MEQVPTVIILGGPNGSGKSTVAPIALKQQFGVSEFVNADVIASGLSGFHPESVAVEAGRIMIERLQQLAATRVSFSLETTLAARSLATFVQRLQRESNYRFHLLYIWLRSPELNVARVKARVLRGGHDIPEDTIHRRYFRSVRNFFDLYLPIADSWQMFENSNSTGPEEVAAGVRGRDPMIFNRTMWTVFQDAYDGRIAD
jgi:predicted ABC-type ATPase